MMESIMNGKYSDICIIFNGEKIHSHMGLLKDVSKYFAVVSKGNFKEKNTIEITMKQINGETMDSELFKIWIKNLYMETFDLTYFKDKSLVDIIEFYRMMDYFQYNAIEKYDLNKLIEEKINNTKPIGNMHDDMLENYKTMWHKKHNPLFYKNPVGKLCDIVTHNIHIESRRYYGDYYNHKYNVDNYSYKELDEPTKIGLGEICYEYDEKITYEYTTCLLKIFKEDEEMKKKILGISNIKEEDIEKYEKKYHKYINYCMATRYYYKSK